MNIIMRRHGRACRLHIHVNYHKIGLIFVVEVFALARNSKMKKMKEMKEMNAFSY